MIDIKEGDILMVAGVEYPVQSVGDYTNFPISPSFRKLASVTASTRRIPPMSGGKTSSPVEYLTGLKILPLAPIEAELRERLELSTPYELARTYAADEEGYIEVTVEILKL